MAQNRMDSALNYMNGMFNNSADNFINNSVRTNGDNANLLREQVNYANGFLKMLIKTADSGHATFLNKVALAKGHSTITFTRIDPISEGTQLEEGITPAGDEITASTISGTLNQYGKVMYSTDRAAVLNRIDIMEKIKQLLPQSARDTMDTIARKALHEQAGIRAFATKMSYSDTTGITVATAANTIAEITADMGFNFWDIQNIRMTMAAMGAIDNNSTLTCAMGQAGKDSFIRDPWFYITLAKNGKIDMYNDSGIPSILGIKFKILSRPMSYSAGQLVKEIPGATGADYTAAVPLETALLIASDCGVRLDLASAKAAGMGPEFYSVGLVATKEDMLAQREGAGYKFWMGTIIHTPQRVAVYYFASPWGAKTTMITRQMNTIPQKQLGYLNANPTIANATDVKTEATRKIYELARQYMRIVSNDALTVGDVINRATGAALTDADITGAVWTGGMAPAIDLDIKVTSTVPGLLGDTQFHGVLQISTGFTATYKDFVPHIDVPDAKSISH